MSLCLLVLGLVYIPPHISWEFLRPKVSATIAAAFPVEEGMHVEILGPLRLRFFPHFAVQASNVRVTESKENILLLQANQLEFGIGIFELLKEQQWEVNSLGVIDGVMQVETNNLWWAPFMNAKALRDHLRMVRLSNMELLLKGRNQETKSSIDGISALFYLDNSQHLQKIHGETEWLGEKGYFTANFDWDAPHQYSKLLDAYLSSSSLQIQVQADASPAAQSRWSGNVALHVVDKAVFSKYFLPSTVLNNTNKTAPVDLKGTVLLTDDGFQLSGLSMATDNVAGSLSIAGSFGDTPNLNANLQLDRLDLDKDTDVMAAWYDGVVRLPKEQTPENTALQRLLALLLDDVARTMPISLAVNCKALSYHQATLPPFSMALNAKDGITTLQSLTLTLPGKTSLQLSGQIASDQHVLKLSLPLVLQSADGDGFYQWLLGNDATSSQHGEALAHQFQGTLHFTPYGISLQDVVATYGPTQMTMQANIRRDSTPIYDVILTAKHLNLNTQSWAPLLWGKVQDLVSLVTSTDAPTQNWLTHFNNIMNLDLTLDDTVIGTEAHHRIEWVGSISDSVLDMPHFYVQHPLTRFTLQGNYDMRPLKPVFHGEFSGDMLDLDYLRGVWPAALAFPPIHPDGQSKVWSDTVWPIPSLDRIDGSLRVRNKQLTDKGNLLCNQLDMRAIFENNVMRVQSLGFTYPQAAPHTDGEPVNTTVGMKMDIGFSPLSVIGAVAFNNFEFSNQLWPWLPKNMLGGYGSVSGTFGTEGQSVKSWIEHLSVSLSTALTDVRVQGIDMDELITSMNKVAIRSSDLVDASFAAATKADLTTHIYGLSSNIVGQDGMLQLKNTLFNTQYTQTALSGTWNLRNRQITLKGKTAFSLTNPAQQLSFDMAIAGDDTAPKLVFDLTELKKKITELPPQHPGDVKR